MNCNYKALLSSLALFVLVTEMQIFCKEEGTA
jgi:hypothetical protein